MRNSSKLESMKPSKASRTAALVAATRAWHSLASSDPVFDDPFAMRFSPLLWKAIVRFPPLRKYLFESNSTPLRGIATQVIARSRYAEDCLWESVGQGTNQYVMVGAGYDSFALRHPEVQGLTVFELDHPATQDYKRKVLARGELNLPENLHFVPVEFSVTTAGEALRSSSLHPDKTTFFSWLGTTPYLTKEDTLATLQSIAELTCSGSEIVFDYLVPNSLLDDKSREMVRQLKEYTARSGEPIQGEFHPAELGQAVEELGYEVIENLAPADLEQRYFTGREDNMRLFGATYFMRCRCR